MVRAALLGLRLAATNPKNFFLTAGTAVAIAQSGLAGGVEEAATLALYVVLCALGLATLILVASFRNRPVQAALTALKDRLIAHGDAVLAAVFLAFGTARAWVGLAGLLASHARVRSNPAAPESPGHLRGSPGSLV